jgi:ABC-type transport system involved in multi-copper enzyme maturation permease subunit
MLSAFRAGLRSRSIQAILVLGCVLVGAAYLSSILSPRQPKTVALDVGLSGLRMTLVLFSLFWVQELVGREITQRTVLFTIAYPISRSHYILGRFLGVAGLMVLASVLLGLLLWITVLISGGNYEQGFPVVLGIPYWLTVFGLWLDALVVAAFALWIATLSTVPVLPLALGLAFAVAGKTLGAVVEYMVKGAEGDAEIMRLAPVVEIIQHVLPDLSRLDWRAWPMYGVAPELQSVVFAILMAASYASLLLTLSTISFSKREIF